MRTLRNTPARLIHKLRNRWREIFPQQVHVDRAAKVEIWKRYGNERSAERDSKFGADLTAQTFNANVNIASRAIRDAIKSLPIEIVGVETVNNRETAFVDVDHEANQVIRHPNPEMTIRQMVSHNVDSYLNDGNGYMTIERQTGPNGAIEIWPRDPKEVTVMIDGGKPGRYRIGKDTHNAVLYQRNRVIHIRDWLVIDPIYGRPRFDAVRDEIEMDWWILQFNKKFFQSGAALNLMFTPDVSLTEDQHDQLLEAMKNELGGGLENAFGLFINRFAGKLENGNMKHKDMAFMDLSKHNREKIFGVFGLPPFRGGVMEFANYANALAQDADFWHNTIKPITDTLADAYNKQLIWPFFGEDIALRFSFDDVAALKGDPHQQALTHGIYLRENALTIDEVREELGRPPLEESDTDEPNDEPEVTPEEEEELTLTLHRAFRKQKQAVRNALEEYTVGGAMMSRLHCPADEAVLFFDGQEYQELMSCVPLIKTAVRSYVLSASGAFKPNKSELNRAIRLSTGSLANINYDTLSMLEAVLQDADERSWTLQQTFKRITPLFSNERARRESKSLLLEAKTQGRKIVSKRQEKKLKQMGAPI